MNATVAVALAVGAIAIPGGAQAAKVTETAPGGVLANGADSGFAAVAGAPLEQRFKLSGEKVKKRQVLDVNLTVNSTGSADGAAGQLRAKLVSPKGDNIVVIFGLVARSLVELKFDDQSEFALCNPFFTQASDCNYLQGGTSTNPPFGADGFYTGETTTTPFGDLNPVFKGTNPKGTWSLFWWDHGGGPISTIGETTLEVKTGRRFEKED